MSSEILVVEDEPSIADNINYALSTEGFKPVCCQTAGDAKNVLSQRKISLIILDVGLPDGNGFELAKEIRKTSPVPIIFVTARSDEVDRIVGLEIGADDYVVKPFSPRELTARVKAVLRRAAGSEKEQSESEDKLVVSGFEIDFSKQRVLFNGKPLELSRYELRILHVMAKRPGHVFSRTRLMELAWEEPEMSLDRTVDTHVKTLRQKIRAIEPDSDVIVTHRGIGYSLKEVT